MISLYEYRTGRYLGQGQVNVAVPPTTTPPTGTPTPTNVVLEPAGTPVVPGPATVVTPAPAAPSYGMSPIFWIAGGVFAAGLIAYIVTSGKK